MSAVQWHARRALAVALLTTSLLAVPVAAQTNDGTGDGTGTYDGTGAGLVIDERTTGGPTGATTDGTTGGTTGSLGEGAAGANGAAAGTGGAQQSPTLTLEPDTGPPGSSVTAYGDGFGACYDVYDDVGQGTATITWGGASVTTVDVDDGTVSVDFPVPESAEPGSTRVIATCDADGELAASTDFLVTAADEAMDPSDAGGDGPLTSDPTAQDTAPTPGDEPVADPAQDAGGPEAEAADADTPMVDGKRVGQLAAVVLGVGAVAALRRLAVRARRRPAWARANVAAVPGAVTRNVLGITPPTPPAPPAQIVRIEPRAGIVTHVLEEADQ
jgi:hypothetical protein